MNPNRENGSWLPEVESCPNRAIPCGNPADADQAMRARQIIDANPDDRVAILQAEQAINHAHQISKHCKVPEGQCPLEKYFQCGRFSALNKLAGIE